MTRTEEDIEAAAQILGTYRPHPEIYYGRFVCQWPEQSNEFALRNGSFKIGHGCRGCLVALVASNRAKGYDAFVKVDFHIFYGQDAIDVTRRAIAYAADNQTELLERHSAEVAA